MGAAGAAGEDETTTTRERRARLRRAAPEFDSRLHRCLEGELKDLYVAVTRARRKLWVFDDRSVSSSRRRRNGSTAVTTRILRERSDTMYDYLLRRSLVVADESMEVVVGDDGNKGGGAGSTLEAFDEGSTDEEWREQGLTLMLFIVSGKDARVVCNDASVSGLPAKVHCWRRLELTSIFDTTCDS